VSTFCFPRHPRREAITCHLIEMLSLTEMAFAPTLGEMTLLQADQPKVKQFTVTCASQKTVLSEPMQLPPLTASHLHR
jgi:hypothetical protein